MGHGSLNCKGYQLTSIYIPVEKAVHITLPFFPHAISTL
jgi:hypothetical protein